MAYRIIQSNPKSIVEKYKQSEYRYTTTKSMRQKRTNVITKCERIWVGLVGFTPGVDLRNDTVVRALGGLVSVNRELNLDGLGGERVVDGIHCKVKRIKEFRVKW